MAKSNIVLIGMAGAGKSTIGRILASQLNFPFIDSDQLIEQRENKSLQTLLDSEGYLGLRKIEEEAILTINTSNTVIATGGSAIYSEKAITHLAGQGVLVFLDVPLPLIQQRIGDYSQRGLAKPKAQTLSALYNERHPLYQQHANITVSKSDCKATEIAADIMRLISSQT
ncbi:shikimate kinase [Marinagarivorans cellulosilyticus]|uniref:Shikimate kinase n=1 Tax=Marinagarivorans cellulosilyticus TaxID=2721545 RepID=A0AAN2BLA2_9GAMM|nr:shikimate kinase [Marinagarivorans cellulosilyticus]BCD98805.1 shikimate kinase [Marinagarivorans cellulosilyticus]